MTSQFYFSCWQFHIHHTLMSIYISVYLCIHTYSWNIWLSIYDLCFPLCMFVHIIYVYRPIWGHEIWSVTIRDEHRLSVSENGMLRRIFGLTRVKATKIKQICTLLNFTMCIIRKIILRFTIWREDDTSEIRHRWEDNDKICFKEEG